MQRRSSQGKVIQESEVLRLVGQVGFDLRRGVLRGWEVGCRFVSVGHCAFLFLLFLSRVSCKYIEQIGPWLRM